MKARIFLASAILATAAAPAFAADLAFQALQLNANAAKVCVLGAPSATSHTFNAGDIDVNGDAIADNNAFATFTFGDSYCNTAHSLRISSLNKGMTTVSGAAVSGSDDFAERIDYLASVSNWGTGDMNDGSAQGGGVFGGVVDPEAKFITDGTDANEKSYDDIRLSTRYRNDALPTGGGAHGGNGLEVFVSTQAGSQPLIAGGYADTLVVAIAAD